MSEPTPKAKPRVIIEQQADGKLVLESYTNGIRKQITLQLGFELFEIKEELRTQQRALDAYAERERERIAKANKARHDRVRRTIEQTPGQGIAFATKVMGPKQAHSDTAIADLERVCHCGQVVVPFMEKCVGCPGYQGAGKQLKVRKVEQQKKEIKEMLALL